MLGLAGVLLASIACGRPSSPSPPTPEFEVSVAWTAEGEDGLRVVVEPLPRHALGELTGYDEAQILHQDLGLGPEVHLLRLHLIGDDERSRSCGEVLGGDGVRFSWLGPPAPGLSPRARNLWWGLAGGEDLAVQQERRTFLLRGSHPLSGASARWERAGQHLDLHQRQWSGREREAFLDGDTERKDG